MAVTMALALFLGTAIYASIRPDVGAPMAALVLLAGLLAGFRFLCGDAVAWNPSPMHWPAVLFLVYAAGRYVTSPLEHPARLELLQVALGALAYFVAATQLHRARDRFVLMVTLAMLVILESFYGIWQCATQAKTVLDWLRPEGYRFRAGGTFICPNNYATFLILSLGLLLGYGLMTRLDRRALERNLTIRLLFLYAALMAVVGIMASFSRAGWLATIITLVFMVGWGWAGFRVSWPKLAGVVLLLGLMAFAAWNVGPVHDYIRRTVRLDASAKDQGVLREASLGGRVHMWQGSLQLISEKPVTGHGIGTWQWLYQRIQHPSIQSHPEHAHNDLLQLAAEYGLAGFALLAWLFAAFYREAARFRDPGVPAEQRAFVIGTAAGVTGALCHAWFDFPFHIPANSLLLAVLLGHVAGMGDPRRPQALKPLPRWTQRLLGGVLVLVSLGVGWVYVPAALSFHYTAAGHEEKLRQVFNRDIPQALYEKAIHWDARHPEPHSKLGDLLRSQAVWMLALAPDKAPEGRRLAESAVAHYQRALDLNPYSTEWLLRQGAALELLGQDDRALTNYLRAVALSPVNAYNHNTLGRHYRKRGDEKRALAHFEKAQILNNWTDTSSQVNLIELQTPEEPPPPPPPR